MHYLYLCGRELWRLWMTEHYEVRAFLSAQPHLTFFICLGMAIRERVVLLHQIQIL